MGLFDKFKKNNVQNNNAKHKRTLAEDIPEYAEWAKKNLNKTGYNVDYDLESIKEVERFFSEQSQEGGVLVPGKSGTILFAIGCFIGETIIRIHGGCWQTDDDDPEGEKTSQLDYQIIR